MHGPMMKAGLTSPSAQRPEATALRGNTEESFETVLLERLSRNSPFIVVS